MLGLTADELRRRLAGQTILEVQRRAKYILLGLAGGDSLVIHLGMTGSLTLSNERADDGYRRCVFVLDDGRRLLFRDVRRLGNLRLLGSEQLRTLDQRLGPEPLAGSFTPQSLASRLNRKRSPIKAVLLDQSMVAGLGNIYADEALHRAGIHPLRAASSLNQAEIEALHAAVRMTLQEAIRDRGTTLSDYRDGYGRAGGHLPALRVYRRTGLPCLACGMAVERLVVGGRSTHFCPRCQPRTGR